MYIRSKSFKRKKDKKLRTYYYLVEAKKVNDKVNQKVIRYLGTAESVYRAYEKLDKINSKVD